MVEIDTKEWKFVFFISCILVAITSLPVIVGIISSPEGKTFLGSQWINASDTPVYYSWIEQAKEGHLLFKSLYTSEDQIRYIFDPFWLGVGLFAKIFSLSSFSAYQLARIFLIPIFLAVSYMFLALFFQKIKQRKISLLLLVFSAGIGGIIWPISMITPFAGPPPMDLWAVETITFYEIYHSPHFLASLTFTLLTFLLMLLALKKQKMVFSFLAGLSSLFLFQFHPYNVPIVYGVIGTYMIIEILRSSTLRWNFIKHYFLLVAVSLPAVIYHFWTLQTFESRTSYALQNTLLSPPLYNFLFTYGFIGLAACIGIIFFIRKKQFNNFHLFLIVWFVVHLILSKLPFLNFQRKTLEGFHVVLVIMATYGVFYLKEYLGKNKFIKKNILQNPAAVILIAIPLLTFSNLAIILRDINLYLNHAEIIYPSNLKISAAMWLGDNSPPDSVVASTETNGNLIPAFSARTVYLGHSISTADYGFKQKQIESFFKKYSDKTRIAFLKFNNINYLFFGPEEKTAANFDPDTADYLKKVYQNNEVSIYKTLNP